MRAYIKKDKRKIFRSQAKRLGFGTGVFTSKAATNVDIEGPNYYYRKITDHLLLVIDKQYRLRLITPMGESPFMELHKDKFKDLLDLELVEYRKGEFDQYDKMD